MEKPPVIKQNACFNSQERRKSYTKPKLPTIDEICPTIDLLTSRCVICRYQNTHILKFFACKNCKTINC